MPQMMPMFWLSLFFFFYLMFFMLILLIYFLYLPMLMKPSFTFPLNNWMWMWY